MNVSRKFIIAFVIVTSVLLSSFSFYIYQMLNTPNLLVGVAKGEEPYVIIPTGSDFKDVQRILHEGNYVNDLVSFSFLAKVMGYDEQVMPGLYVLEPDMSNLAAVRMLRSGAQTPVRVTFNNIRMPEELAERITKNIEATETDFLTLFNDPTVAAGYGFDEETFMAMFIPNTYELWYTTTAKELMDRMYEEYQKFWTPERLAKADSLRLTPVEVSVLASIVQAETNLQEEKPTIAGVYLNRLQRNIALQADPTLVFAAGDFTIKRVLNKHKEIESPYNTYKYTGLPPGPINLPSIQSINAVLNAGSHSYLYFCADEDLSGRHVFATNLADHLRNARQFQQALNAARVYQ